MPWFTPTRNHGEDVYEYVDGRAQLITPGTGDSKKTELSLYASPPGLIGVSADGRDIYFSTYNTLVSQDHNGLFLKFYDARAGGGFPAPAPAPPCDAADECHGSDNPPPTALPLGPAPNVVVALPFPPGLRPSRQEPQAPS